MNWKRDLFFVFEKLKITPAERKSLTALMALLVVIATLNHLMEPSSPFDKEYYRDLRREYYRRSRILQEEEGKILARYQPALATVTDTVPGVDSLDQKRFKQTSNSTVRININTATTGQLQKLPGIGPAYSRRIIDYRNKHGAFTTIEELLQIKGIGKKRLEKLKPFVKLKDKTNK